ncbi:MAG: hypothetical protein M1837_000080 [Sclerophora amabilis]|nr:MAG: hypothetical protein M1837_000080 [Sclerophora amabilis]
MTTTTHDGRNGEDGFVPELRGAVMIPESRPQRWSAGLALEQDLELEKTRSPGFVTFKEMLEEMEEIARTTGTKDARHTWGQRGRRAGRQRQRQPGQNVDVDPKPIDGGTRAWATVVASHLVIFNLGGWNGVDATLTNMRFILLTRIKAFGVFQSYYSTTLLPDTSPALISWIGSFQLFFSLFLGTVVGRAIDAGYWRVSLNGGSACLVVFTLLTSFCKSWWQLFLVQGILTGIANGMMLCTITLILRTYFSTKLAFAIGLATSGSCTGAIVFSLVTRQLLPQIGFQWTIRVAALVMLCTLVPVNIFIRMGPGLKPVSAPLIDWTAFRDLPYMLMIAGLFLCFWGVYFGFYYIVSFGVDVLHLTEQNATDLLIYMNVTNFFGRIIPNLISDHWSGPLDTLIPAMVLSALVLFLWIICTTQISLIVIACVYGLTSGSLQSLNNAATIGFVPDVSRIGVRIGMAFTSASFGALTGTPLGGWLIQIHGGGYLYAQIFAGASIAVGSGLLLVARILKKGLTGRL